MIFLTFLCGIVGGAFVSWFMDIMTERAHSKSDVRKMFNDLYEEIRHGDPEHQTWLKDKINQFCERKGLR